MNWPRLVSALLSPPPVWALMALPVSLRDAGTLSQGLVSAGIYILFVSLLPMLYVVAMVRRGHITSLDMPLREQRRRPFLVSIACTAIAWWLLRSTGAPGAMPFLALCSLALIAAIALITLAWQVSMHMMSMTGVLVAAWAFFGPVWALALSPLWLLVAAARLRLGRHNLAQLLGGALVGVLVPLLLFALQG